MDYIGLNSQTSSARSVRQNKAALICWHIGNLRAILFSLAHSKIERTVRHFGVEIDDAIEIAEKIDI